jgi:hypothetical protein
MSNAALWREVFENTYGLLKLPLPYRRRKHALQILDQRLMTLKGMSCGQDCNNDTRQRDEF